MFKPIKFLPTENIHGRLLPWVVGVMVFLSGLAIALSLSLQNTISTWQGDLSRQVTVQIVEADRTKRMAEAEAALDILSATPGVEAAHLADDSDIDALLEPWLGAGNVTPELPVPALIQVTLTEDAAIDLDALGTTLTDAAPSARLDRHDHWLTDLLVLARVVQWISALIVGLVVLATVAVTVFATRAGLAAQRETVEIVHMMGAKDTLIAGAFQRRFLWVGLIGGLYGLGLLVVVFAMVFAAASGIESAYVPEVSLTPMALGILLALPVPAALIAMITARYTVLRALHEMV